MKVPAGRITVGMTTEQHGRVTSINHHDGPHPVVIEGENGIALHTNEDMVEVTAGVHRVQYYDFAWGGFRDVEPFGSGSCFISEFKRADALTRRLMAEDGNPRRDYRLVKADGSITVYRRRGMRIVTAAS